MIDSHCHIGFNPQEDLKKIIENAKNAGIIHMLSIACDKNDYDPLIRLLNEYPMVYGAFGIHPENCADMPLKTDLIKKIKAHPHIIGVGEMGLDYHYMEESKEKQRRAFEEQIEVAFQVKKPIIIHTRDADEDTISILSSAKNAHLLKYGGVIHCFTGSEQLANFALDIGFYISASGVITFKKSDSLRNIFSQIPLNKLLVETDSPYLAPVPYRGHPNEPAYVIKTAEKLAEIKGVSINEIEEITTHNFYHLFQIQEDISLES